jgi:hypothetical protein
MFACSEEFINVTKMAELRDFRGRHATCSCLETITAIALTKKAKSHHDSKHPGKFRRRYL